LFQLAEFYRTPRARQRTVIGRKMWAFFEECSLIMLFPVEEYWDSNAGRPAG